MKQVFPDGALRRFVGELRELRLPGRSGGILLAASGGADSTALCRLVAGARERDGGRGWPAVWIGHVHHGLRGEEADADLEFTRGLAEGLGLGFLEARAEVRGLARERGLSLEAAARSARYRAFADWADERGLDDVLLGHTASDQVETVLLRALRGAGPRGLRGMPRERRLRGGGSASPRVVRPLLSWTRPEVLDLLTRLSQPFREDSSNLDLSFLRNRLRHFLLPRLREEDPAIDRVLLQLAGLAGRLWRLLETEARTALESAMKKRTDRGIHFSREALAALPRAVRSTAIYLAAEELALEPAADQLSPAVPRQLAALGSWIEAAGEAHGPQDLGEGLRGELRREVLILSRSAAPSLPAPPAVELSVPGSAAWGCWRIRVEPAPEAAFLRERGLRRARDQRLSELVDRSAIEGPLRIRARLPGDRFRPLGAPGSRKLKEILRESGVAPHERNGVPLLADARGIVWVVPHRLADRCRVRPESRHLLRLEAYPTASDL